MTPFEIIKPLKNLAGGSLDANRGPYLTVEEACLAIPSVVVEGVNFREGKQVDIGTGGVYRVWWWQGGYEDEDLVEMLIKGDTGWSPDLVSEADGEDRMVLKLRSWINGTGTAPTTNVGLYFKSDGTYTAIKADAANFKGPEGEKGDTSVITNITYADLISNTYTNSIYSNKTVFLIYYDPNGLQKATLVFIGDTATLPFTAQTDFTGTIIGTTNNTPSPLKLDAFNNSSSYIVGSQVTDMGILWEANENTIAGEAPGLSGKWDKVIYDNENNNPIFAPRDLLTSAVNIKNAITVDNTNGDIYHVTYNSTTLNIIKNNVVIKTQTFGTPYNSNMTRVAACHLTGKIHIVITSYSVGSSDNPLKYLIYDVATNLITAGNNISTGVNSVLKAQNIVLHNGELYIPVTTVQLIVGGAVVAGLTNVKVDLYKLSGVDWVFVTEISKYAEIWGARWVASNGTTYATLSNPYIPLENALFSTNAGLFCISTNGAVATQTKMLFTKVSTDNGLTWSQDNVQNYTRGYFSFGYQDKWGNINLITRKYLDAAYGANAEIQIFNKNDGFNYFKTGIGNFDPAFLYANGNIYIAWWQATKFRVISFTEEQVNNCVNTSPLNFVGKISPSSTPSANLMVGDYYETEEAGTYSNFLEKQIPYGTFTNVPISVRLGEKVQIIWTGTNFRKKVSYDTSISSNTSIPFEHNVQANPFFSLAFRIPLITSTDKATIIGLSDIRYTRGADYDEISVGSLRSLDAGKSWNNPKVAFKKPAGDGLRIHDGGIVVDRHKTSAQLGRIWSIAKLWDANVDPADATYWYANTNKVILYSCYSTDDGLTWSTPDSAIDSLRPAGNSLVSSGANTGIMMSNGTLILPMYWAFSNSVQVAGFLYKPTGGSWTLGDVTTGDFANENQIIEDKDGSLLMNARSNTGQRKVFRLTSIGTGWVRQPSLEVFQEVIGGCSGSFVKYRDTYLFCQPTSYGSSNRTNITIFYSYDLINWVALFDLSGNISTGGYSSILCDDNYFGVMWEAISNDLKYTDLNYLRNILR